MNEHTGEIQRPNSARGLLSRSVLAIVCLIVWNATSAVKASSYAVGPTINDPSVTSGDQFGFAVATDGGYVLVGARGDDSQGFGVGQASLFDANTGSLLMSYAAPAQASRQFGWSVALHGNRVLVGAIGTDSSNDSGGNAYLFDRDSGTLLQSFVNPAPHLYDLFGYSVAMEGDFVLVGGAVGAVVGEAHLFDATTGILLRTFQDPTPTYVTDPAGELFGRSVAIDGNLVLIGAPHDRTAGQGLGRAGQAYLFDATSGDLLQIFEEPTIISGAAEFGMSVALDGNRALIGSPSDRTYGIGAGEAHLFDTSNGDLLQSFSSPTPGEVDRFGWSVALDGNDVLIGEYHDDTQGSAVGQAHLFDTLSGNFEQTFIDPSPTTADEFGYSVAIGDGYIVIGARGDNTLGPGVGQVHVFTVVPEPSSLLLGVLAVLGLGLNSRLRAQKLRIRSVT